MSILKVARLGHPVIRRRADAVPLASISSADFQRMVDDMIETMHEYDGVGIAAPQVHVSSRLIVFEVGADLGSKRPDASEVPLTVLVNPSFTGVGSEESEGWEGCLSVPDLRGVVPRFSSVRVDGWDRSGTRIEFQADGFHARVIQHECDHIDGRVYLDRMRSLDSLTHLNEFHRYWVERR